VQISEYIKAHSKQVVQGRTNQSKKGRQRLESNKRGIRKIPQNKKIKKGENER
jgi:hypothetical protein